MSAFRFAAPRPARRISLTPMIDVVFLLLVFFMLVAQFGADGAVTLRTGGAEARWTGPPRLVGVLPQSLTLNGVPMEPPALVSALAGLMETPEDPVILQPAPDASLQRLVEVIELMQASGYSSLAVAEGAP